MPLIQVFDSKALGPWAKLILELSFSATVSFLFACGVGLMSFPRAPYADIGAGMMWAALAMTVVWRRSPTTKGLIVALPADEATKEIQSNIQTVQK